MMDGTGKSGGTGLDATVSYTGIFVGVAQWRVVFSGLCFPQIGGISACRRLDRFYPVFRGVPDDPAGGNLLSPAARQNSTIRAG
ncbi:MAG TPA: hypothetical protein DCG04_14165, partial [Rhodospirillaceae bacterium]|nr:hypothetical protein [Rhodospirillaceae bacterium]